MLALRPGTSSAICQRSALLRFWKYPQLLPWFSFRSQIICASPTVYFLREPTPVLFFCCQNQRALGKLRSQPDFRLRFTLFRGISFIIRAENLFFCLPFSISIWGRGRWYLSDCHNETFDGRGTGKRTN